MVDFPGLAQNLHIPQITQLDYLGRVMLSSIDVIGAYAEDAAKSSVAAQTAGRRGDSGRPPMVARSFKAVRFDEGVNRGRVVVGKRAQSKCVESVPCHLIR